jgi:hypothetical protein
LKRVGFLPALLVTVSFSFVGCGGGSAKVGPPSGLTERVFASQDVTSATSFGGLVIINGEYDTLARAREISAGSSPGLMAISPDRSMVLAFDAASNSVQVVNTEKEALSGSIPLAGPTTSMVIVTSSVGYAAVPATPLTGSPPGAIVVMNLAAGGISARISVPNAQTVVASPSGTQLLAFPANDNTGSVIVVSPLLVNTGSPVTTTVSGFDYPVYAVFSGDGTTAYVLNCGPQCGSNSASASVQPLDMGTLTAGTPVPVDGATVGFLSGSTLYVAGTPTASASNSSPNNSCAGETTAATICGRLDSVDLGAMAVTGSFVITNGYHDRIDLSTNGQLFVGSYGCTNIGDVNNPVGEVRGCLSIFNTTTGAVVIPPDNGDVTGLQSFTSRDVEYVAEGGRLRVYDTLIDSLLLNDYIETGTITIGGQIIDVKAVDFF